MMIVNRKGACATRLERDRVSVVKSEINGNCAGGSWTERAVPGRGRRVAPPGRREVVLVRSAGVRSEDYRGVCSLRGCARRTAAWDTTRAIARSRWNRRYNGDEKRERMGHGGMDAGLATRGAKCSKLWVCWRVFWRQVLKTGRSAEFLVMDM